MKKCRWTTVGQLNGSHELRAAVLGTSRCGGADVHPHYRFNAEWVSGGYPPSLPPSLSSFLAYKSRESWVGRMGGRWVIPGTTAINHTYTTDLV